MNSRHPELVLSDEEARAALRRKTRRAFLIGGVATAGLAGAYGWFTSAEEEEGVAWPKRRILDFNGKLSHAYLNDSHMMPLYRPVDVRPLKPNGNIGLSDPVEDDWTLDVSAGVGPALNLSLEDLKALPRSELITRFCCIEGWSTIVQWSGTRFSDFTKKYFPPGRTLPRFVSMNTPDEEYYVGLDMKSALHPQTLLAYELNGQPLTAEHGAPLRLAMPVKYGIKNIKRIGTIQYTDTRPADYWAEEGYDWFAGL
jgi:DMSO/TMAO reductase YedYZ molybdopterin-dependent catalytic subunit